jgi:hypothetical protein
MPKSNSALNKFDKDTPQSVERKQFAELVSNEFNDARSQVIKRLFEQSAIYNELFDKQRTLGNTVVAYSLGKELGMFKESIEKAKVKLEDNEKKPFNDILGAYSKLIVAINAYINSTGARSGEIAGLTAEIRNLAPAINELFMNGIRKQDEKKDLLGEERSNITDNDLINLYLLFEKIQSGYAEGQTLLGVNLAGVVSASDAEKARLRDQLRFHKELILRGIARVGSEDRQPRNLDPPTITPFETVFIGENTPAGRRAREIAREQQAEEYRQFQQDYIERYGLQLPRGLSDRQDPNFFEVPARVDGDYVPRPPRPAFPLPAGLDRGNLPRPPQSPIQTGQGKPRRGRRGVNPEMSRSYELIQRWSGFPYFVPPSAPAIPQQKNPSARVDRNTEGSGRKKGKKSGKPKYTDI